MSICAKQKSYSHYMTAIDRGGKKQGDLTAGGAIDRGAIDLDSP